MWLLENLDSCMGLASYFHRAVLALKFRPSSAVWERSPALAEPGSSRIDQVLRVMVQLFILSVHLLSACCVLGIMLRGGVPEVKNAAQKPKWSLPSQNRPRVPRIPPSSWYLPGLTLEANRGNDSDRKRKSWHTQVADAGSSFSQLENSRVGSATQQPSAPIPHLTFHPSQKYLAPMAF